MQRQRVRAGLAAAALGLAAVAGACGDDGGGDVRETGTETGTGTGTGTGTHTGTGSGTDGGTETGTGTGDATTTTGTE